MFPKKLPACLLPLTLLVPAAFAQTTVLTFDLGSPGNIGLPQDYGDRVTAGTMGSYSYGGGGTYTPNVTVSQGGTANFLTRWTTGYNDLVNVAENDADGDDHMRFSLNADAGFHVALNGFDIGNFGGPITLPAVRVLDPFGAVLFEELDVALNTGSSPDERNFLFPAPPHAQTLIIDIELLGLGGQSDNVCIDNISFSQTTAPSIGVNYCGPAVVNSSGQAGTMIALGSTAASANDLQLVATGLPRFQFGYFLTSQTQGLVMNPGGSQGNLCLAGTILRFNQNVGNTGPTEHLAMDIDTANLPSPGTQILTGETWSFSAWFRDVPGTSNFTDGIEILFN